MLLLRGGWGGVIKKRDSGKKSRKLKSYQPLTPSKQRESQRESGISKFLHHPKIPDEFPQNSRTFKIQTDTTATTLTD